MNRADLCFFRVTKGVAVHVKLLVSWSTPSWHRRSISSWSDFSWLFGTKKGFAMETALLSIRLWSSIFARSAVLYVGEWMDFNRCDMVVGCLCLQTREASVGMQFPRLKGMHFVAHLTVWSENRMSILRDLIKSHPMIAS